jgi:hypothetical protein
MTDIQQGCWLTQIGGHLPRGELLTGFAREDQWPAPDDAIRCRGVPRCRGSGPPIHFVRARESISIFRGDPPWRIDPYWYKVDVGDRTHCDWRRASEADVRGKGGSPPVNECGTLSADCGIARSDPSWGRHNGREDIATARGHPPWTGEFARGSPELRACVTILGIQVLGERRLDNSSGISPPVRSVHARDSITLGRGDVGWRKRRIPGRWSMSDLQGISPPVDECGIINADCGLERRDSPKRHRWVPSDKDVGPHQIGVTKQEIICN